MRLATFRSDDRDGRLFVVVEDDGDGPVAVPAPYATLQAALDDWVRAEPQLRAYASGSRTSPDARPVRPGDLCAPLPRAYQWAEGSTYLAHMERIRRARGKALPPGHGERPAVYQSGSDSFLPPVGAIEGGDEAWGLDVEATIAVVVDDVPRGIAVERAAEHIKLVVLANDLTYRHVLTEEYAIGVGFYQAKPVRPLAPFAVTPDALGGAWDPSGPALTVRTWINDGLLGAVDAGRDCAFSFPELIAHMARARPLGAGTLVGSGTVANRDPSNGFGCIAERRAEEALAGEPSMPFLAGGDRIRMEAFDAAGRSVFGAMEHHITPNEQDHA